MDQKLIQTHQMLGFYIATGEAAHVKCRAGSGLWVAVENSGALEKA